jgi:nucleoid-associated protein YgaU
VTVVAGDSLWVIAERLLPPTAGDHEITATWHQLLRANADRIGADPDLIFPGTRLLLPASGSRAPGAKPINERTSGERRS